MLGSDRLHTWLVFAEDASLSRAAQRLHLSQPAVHAQLRALSEEVGVPLYTREGRGLALTREGAELATFARELDERTGELLARLRGEHDDRSLILAAGAGALVHVLPVGLRAFARRHPATAIEVVSANAQQAAQLVRSGLAHVGVGVLDPAPDDLEHQVLAHAAQTIVVPRAHRLASKRSASRSSRSFARRVSNASNRVNARLLYVRYAVAHPRVAARTSLRCVRSASSATLARAGLNRRSRVARRAVDTAKVLRVGATSRGSVARLRATYAESYARGASDKTIAGS